MTEQTRQKIKNFGKKAVRLLLNPRFVMCFGIAWFLTNGWSYVALGMGTFFGIPWLTAIATGYLALLWIPFTPEKLITAAIAIALLRWLFPQDQKTLAVLRRWYEKAKNAVRRKREEHREKKQ